MRRPQNFEKSSPYFWMCLLWSKVRWRFRKILWPSQNIWTLNITMILVLSIIVGIPPYKPFDKALAWKLEQVELSQHCVNFSTINKYLKFFNLVTILELKTGMHFEVSNIKRFKLLLRKNYSFWLMHTEVWYANFSSDKTTKNKNASSMITIIHM